MSDNLEINDNNIVYEFNDAIPLINEKYLLFLNELLEKFKYHEELSGSIQHDIKLMNEKLISNKYQIINTITDNFLFCLEQIADYNSDYFIYQKEKVHRKNGKVYKNKLPKVGNKTLLKTILEDSDSSKKIFNDIVDIFYLLTFKNDNNLVFNDDYVQYVKDNFDDNKNYSKILMVFDNVDNILNSELIEETEDLDNVDDTLLDEDNKKNNKNNKNSKNSKKNKNKKIPSIGPEFMKSLENTKIAQLAKNISEKININDFPSLNDPSKLLSSFTNPSEEGGIGNLLKFVVGEVETALKSNNLNETDLVGEAQNLMGQFQNMSGFNPMSILENLGGEGGFDPSQFASIFENMKK
jgi:hypothetical protein